MIILLIIGVVLAGAAIGIITHVLSPGRQQQAEGITHIERYGFRRRPAQDDESAGGMMDRLDRVAARLGSAVGGGAPGVRPGGGPNPTGPPGMWTTGSGEILGDP